VTVFLSQRENRKGYRSTETKGCTHFRVVSAYLCCRKTLKRPMFLIRLEPGRSFVKYLKN